MSSSLWPHGLQHPRLSCPSLSPNMSLHKLTSIELVMLINHLIVSPPSPFAFDLSQHQGLFQWVGFSHQVAKALELQLKLQSFQFKVEMGFPGGSDGKESACNAGDLGSIPGLGRSPREGNDNPLQYTCLENPRDREAWWAAVYGVAQSRTRLRWLSSSSSSSSIRMYLEETVLEKLQHWDSIWRHTTGPEGLHPRIIFQSVFIFYELWFFQ